MATDTALVTITVDATVEANDDSATTPANTPVAVDVLANDLVNGAPAAAGDLTGVPVITVQPTNGTVVWNSETGQFDYTPDEGFCGTDTFEYEIEKTCGASADCDITVVLEGSASVNSTSFEAPGFEWGVTPVFGLFHPDLGESVYFEWDGGENIYFSAAGVGCGGEEPQPGWTLEVEGAAPSDVCVIAGCS